VIDPRLILCSGANSPAESPLREGRHVIALNAHGPQPNVHIRFNDVARAFQKHLSARLTDLVEVAAYTYAADCGTSRGEQWQDEAATEPWGRDFHLVIPVRDLTFWNRDDVQTNLVQVLTFLSNDTWAFTFVPWEEPELVQGFLELGDQEDWPFRGVERAVMFSGGLDSLAGVVESLGAGRAAGPGQPSARGRSIDPPARFVLRPGRPVSATDHPRPRLAQQTAPGPRGHTAHALFPLLRSWRSGSSLHGGGRCQILRKRCCLLDLPVADEVVGARASRTTHPKALGMLSRLHSLVMDRPFAVDNPYLFRTKTEVVATIAEHGAGRLIGLSRSCSRGMFVSKTQWHCGVCSQCIDRRIAVLDAGQEANEQADDYVVDVFTGPRKDGPDKNIAVGYARHATELHKMSDEAISSRFNADFARPTYGQPKASAAAQQLVALHRRHADSVVRVLQAQIQAHTKELLEASLPETSLLALVAGRKHITSTWQRLADRIAEHLSIGVPLACKTEKPKNEPHLQQICDGILQAKGSDLQREFPFARWSASATKPDWSSEQGGLWVELKYVRKRSDIHQITEDIAADITKYGDTGLHVLFVVYDPQHEIDSDERFAEPIQARPQFRMQFVR
jgi:REase_DpnII-MboI